MSKIYVLSGLGVDHRVFDSFEFNNSEVHFVSWIIPFKKETLSSYAKRIAEQIEEENPVIVGLSFGGMVAVEIAKIRQVSKVILLASAKGRQELPKSYLFIGKCKFHHGVPSSFLTYCNFLTYWFFGVSTLEDKKLLKTILADTNPDFLAWAIDAILNWNNKEIPANVIHIHGSKDRLLPSKNCSYDYLIEGAGHFMTVSHAKEIECLMEENILSK
ncbi:alpha/beta fold hydrolase [Myroides odoratus]